MQTRVAVMSAIVENTDSVEKLNELVGSSRIRICALRIRPRRSSTSCCINTANS